jgi:hypothetical protein
VLHRASESFVSLSKKLHGVAAVWQALRLTVFSASSNRGSWARDRVRIGIVGFRTDAELLLPPLVAYSRN